LQVIATYQEREHSVYLAQLDSVTKSVVKECTGLIDGAIQHLTSRYGDSLRPGGSGGKVRDAYKKAEWMLRDREWVQQLQEKLRRNTERLSFLNGLAAR